GLEDVGDHRVQPLLVQDVRPGLWYVAGSHARPAQVNSLGDLGRGRVLKPGSLEAVGEGPADAGARVAGGAVDLVELAPLPEAPRLWVRHRDGRARSEGCHELIEPGDPARGLRRRLAW